MMGIVVRVKAALRSIAFLDSSSSNFFRLSPPERRYADVLGLSDWPRYLDSGLAEPKGKELHDLR